MSLADKKIQNEKNQGIINDSLFKNIQLTGNIDPNKHIGALHNQRGVVIKNSVENLKTTLLKDLSSVIKADENILTNSRSAKPKKPEKTSVLAFEGAKKLTLYRREQEIKVFKKLQTYLKKDKSVPLDFDKFNEFAKQTHTHYQNKVTLLALSNKEKETKAEIKSNSELTNEDTLKAVSKALTNYKVKITNDKKLEGQSKPLFTDTKILDKNGRVTDDSSFAKAFAQIDKIMNFAIIPDSFSPTHNKAPIKTKPKLQSAPKTPNKDKQIEKAKLALKESKEIYLEDKKNPDTLEAFTHASREYQKLLPTGHPDKELSRSKSQKSKETVAQPNTREMRNSRIKNALSKLSKNIYGQDKPHPSDTPLRPKPTGQRAK